MANWAATKPSNRRREKDLKTIEGVDMMERPLLMDDKSGTAAK